MDLPVIATVLVVILSQWILIVYLLRSKNPVTPQDEAAEEKSLGLLNRAYKKAQNIIGQAELSGIKMRAESKLETRKQASEMSAGIATAANKVEQMLYKSADKANSQFQEFLDDLKAKGEKEEETIVADSRKRVDDYVVKLQTDMSNSLKTDMEQMQKSVEDYKKTKLAAMDANFLAVAERALEILLNKKMSLSDQVELVNEALDKAKQEKLIR